MTESTTPETKNNSQKTIGKIVAEDYRSAAVFEKYGIDFCCGGQVSLATACQTKKLDIDAVQLEIETATKEPIEQRHNYAAWSLSFLADYIVNTHHAYINNELITINSYTHKIADVHGVNHPEVIKIANIFAKIKSDMVEHLREEEEILFPAIKRVEASKKEDSLPDSKDVKIIKISLEKLYGEHEEIGDAVHEIRHLASDYAIPEDGCNTFALTYKKLNEFEDDLHRHVHLENNLLFPNAV